MIRITMQNPYQNRSIQEVLDALQTSMEDGLSDEQVQQRQHQYGRNELLAQSITWWKIFFQQFKSPFIYLLCIAAILSVITHNIHNALIILIILIINSLFSFVQEYRATTSLHLLADYFNLLVKVKRKSTNITISSKELVPGDIVFLEAGSAIPADIRLIETNNLYVDESVLTGESVTVQKYAEPTTNNSAYLGTTVTGGTGIGVIIGTGTHTTFGAISTLTVATPHEGTFQYQLTQLSRFLIYLMIITVILIVLGHLLIKGVTAQDTIPLFMFAVALAISITPEALPAVTTFSLSQGALLLARHKVVVKRLSSIYDIGNITLLCCDKTGTITENKLRIVDSLSVDNNDPILYARWMVPSNHRGNSFDQALQEKLPTPAASGTVLQQTAFDPVRRRSNVLIKEEQGYLFIIKGAYEEIITRSTIGKTQRTQSQQWVQQQGKKGHRILAVAYKKIARVPTDLVKEEDQVTLAGCIAFEDPLKKTAVATLTKARALHITIKILTGDSPDVAGTVAYTAGLIKDPQDVLTGPVFEQMNEHEQEEAAVKQTVFARVTPQQKYKIITYLKRHETVGFLGEGINDAPALKAAHVGMVVQEATDLAKSAADIVLLHKSLRVIIDGIEIGRTIAINTIKYIKISLSSSIDNFYAVALASFFTTYLPLLPLQILLLNLLSDIPLLALATDKVDNRDLAYPASYRLKEIILTMVIFGTINSFFNFIIFFMCRLCPAAILQTSWFLFSIMVQLIFILLMRTPRSIFYAQPPSIFLVIAITIAALVGISAPFIPLGQHIFFFAQPPHAMLVSMGVLIIVYIIVVECSKLLYYRFIHPLPLTK
jgi:P-type Mg2+ transporter